MLELLADVSTVEHVLMQLGQHFAQGTGGHGRPLPSAAAFGDPLHRPAAGDMLYNSERVAGAATVVSASALAVVASGSSY